MGATRRSKTYDLAADRALGRSRREFAAWIGGLLILFNVLAAGLVGASAHVAPALSDAVSGDRIVICGGDGMIVVDRSGRPVEDQRGAGTMLCPFCLPLMQGHAKAPDPVAVAPAPADRAAAMTPVRATAPPAPAPRVCASRPRAPPIL